MGLVDQTFLSFVPRGNGFLYRLPSPWLFVPGRYFVVTAEQKTKLTDAIGERHPGRNVVLTFVVMAVVGLLVIPAMVLIDLALPRSFEDSALAGPLAVAAITLALYGLAVTFMSRMVRRVEATVPDMVPTDERPTRAELTTAREAAVSPALRLAVSLVLCALATFWVVRTLLAWDTTPVPAIGLGLNVAAAIFFAWQSVRAGLQWRNARP